jgi:hypothetical protein
LNSQLDSVSSSIRSIPASKKFALVMSDMVQSLPIVGNGPFPMGAGKTCYGLRVLDSLGDTAVEV